MCFSPLKKFTPFAIYYKYKSKSNFLSPFHTILHSWRNQLKKRYSTVYVCLCQTRTKFLLDEKLKWKIILFSYLVKVVRILISIILYFKVKKIKICIEIYLFIYGSILFLTKYYYFTEYEMNSSCNNAIVEVKLFRHLIWQFLLSVKPWEINVGFQSKGRFSSFCTTINLYVEAHSHTLCSKKWNSILF